MLEFFRRYQKFFFIIITVVIVISFTFFGTYEAFSGPKEKDTVAFTAVDGTKIYSRELNDLVNFLAVDWQAHLHWNVAWGANPFNDDVITNNFLSTGVAEVIVAPYLPKLRKELNSRLEKEKRFMPYANPRAPFVGVEQVWSYFAPDLKKNFDALKSQSDAASAEAFSDRVNLFLAERRFPSSYLKQILRYQETQQSWLTPDEDLPRRDLALFGYHSVQDWFGKDFLQLMAEYIINTAKIAEEKGFQVSKEEAMQSVMTNLQKSFKEAKANPYFAVRNISEYYLDALRRLNMDEARLISLWRQILLFRNYFEVNADSILVSSLPYNDFLARQNEYVEANVFKLPSELCFQTMADVEKFELYVAAVREPKEAKAKGLFALPQKYLLPQEVKKIYPELVQKRYRLRYATCSKEALEAKIGVKKTWEWEAEGDNWKVLQNKFPELAGKVAQTKEERSVLLDALDSKTRGRVDEFSRMQIVDQHPEWIKDSLATLTLKEEVVDVREQGGRLPFIGVQDRAQLMAVLDKAPLQELSEKLAAYSQDKIHYYRIEVVEKPEKEEILTFKEAVNDGTLDMLLNKALEATYLRVRTQKSAQFVRDNGEWKAFAEVKEQMGQIHFEELIRRLDEECAKEEKAFPLFCDWKDKPKARVAVRLLPYMKESWKKMKEQPGLAAQLVRDPKMGPENAFVEQWKLIELNEKAVRNADVSAVDVNEAFSLKPDTFSSLCYRGNAGITFFKVYNKGVLPCEEDVREKVMEARELLGRGLEQELAKVLLVQMQEKGALELEGDGVTK